MTTTSEKVALSFANKCGADGCEKTGFFLLAGLCHFHEAVRSARELNPEDFDALRDALATTAPLSADEKRRRSVKRALHDIEWRARDLKRGKKNAREAGATEGQIRDAVKRGKVAAR